jgi:hypothetical protein
MQQKRNKNPRMTDRIRTVLLELYNNEDIDSWTNDDFAGVSRQRAVELFEIFHIVNLAREATGRKSVALPSALADQILECAKQGMHKGRKSRPKQSYIAKLSQEIILAIAVTRWTLLKADMPSDQAKLQAAEEAEERAKKEFGLKNFKAETIHRRMKLSPFTRG